eukprot:743290-Amphidinium_carterae.1
MKRPASSVAKKPAGKERKALSEDGKEKKEEEKEAEEEENEEGVDRPKARKFRLEFETLPEKVKLAYSKAFILALSNAALELPPGQRQKKVTAIKNAAYVRTDSNRLVVSAEAPIFDEVLALTSSKFQKSYGDGVCLAEA